MAQKNKVKELVGRGLNSYHTKALQQMDRIEKKNKEQNHKISILSNELDNDYLTKTEEGSVISLEHSKEGMVYLDELQGNTLVNYCSDGSKEMTLNGDIDVEGTFITTTEGVDNGKVDVLCEGNTLVNLVSDINSSSFVTTSNNEITYKMNNTAYPACIFKVNGLVNGKTYTSILDVKKNSRFIHMGGTKEGEIRQYATYNTTGRFVNKFTIPSDDNNYNLLSMWTQGDNSDNDLIISYPIILEGDWTNKEIPTSYFEGMKSVGQDDVNGHKIEILSRNKNLIDTVNGELFIGKALANHDGVYNDSNYNTIKHIPVKPNTTYRLSNIAWSWTHDKNKKKLSNIGALSTITIPNDCYYLSITYLATNQDSIQIEEGNTATSYIPHADNKKEILINEPLRGVGNTKDKFVKIGSKWFIKKKCEEIVFDGSDDEKWSFKVTEPSGKYSYQIDPAIVNSNNSRPNGICDKFTFVNWNSNPWNYKSNCISILSKGVYVYTDFTTLSEFKTWLQSNPITLIYELPTPIYEPLEIEPTLNTYNDITHISNNSIIPCNMKIQNSGYNAIIKPSTLYTVALDTNKSGTIGMNLGGVKGTTTNNVLKLTTPATLTDDSLRLYGKGIKGSKVRLLEGDKTNWIPSFFEGMKSSFEDKVQSDGTYKMEILSSNKNLFDAIFRKAIENNANNLNISFKDGKLIVNGNAQHHHIFNVTIPKGTYITSSRDDKLFLHVFWKGGDTSFKSNVVTYDKDTDITCYLSKGEYTNYECSFQIEKNTNVTDFVAPKTNKIQFSSIEPLKKWDKFVFRNGQLMIERGSTTVDLSSFIWGGYEDKDKCYKFGVQLDSAKRSTGNNANLICNSLPVRADETKSSTICIYSHANSMELRICIRKHELSFLDRNGLMEWLSKNPTEIVYELAEPTYEEIPFELQKIILEGYENGTLFLDTNIPPTSTVRYAGETPIVKATKLNKTEVLNNTNDINDNIIPYLMDMDYRVVMLQLATEELEGGVSMARLFGGTYEMIKRDILSKRLTREEYGYRLADYFNAGKLTEEQVRELEELR